MNIRTLGATLATAAAFSLATPILAQEAGNESPSRQVVRKLVSIKFDGGTLSDYVRELRKAAGDTPVNILYPQEFGALRVPAIQLEQVGLYDALEVPAGLSQHRLSLLPDGREASWDVDVQSRGSGAPVFVIEVWADDLHSERDEEEHEEEFDRFPTVQSLAALISGEHALDADAVLSSIQIALEMADQGDADLRFHEDTALLFARVTMQQHDAIEETVGRLMESASFMRNAHSRGQVGRFLNEMEVESIDQAKDMLLQAREMRGMIQDMQREIAGQNDAHRRQVVQMEEEVSVLRVELRQARSVIEDQQRSLSRLEAEAARLQAERAALRDQLEALENQLRPRQ
ncbi:MAG: hypothetical protein ACFCBV_03455 [Phycisphaerales bacterium]